ncbi:MAG: cytochrome c oxidase subunit II [bacterium]|nr:cytochrome c oxidase subunit II [bacterium]
MTGSALLSTWFPEAASTHAASVDEPFYWIYFAAVCFLALFMGLVLIQLRVYRRQDRDQLGAVTGRPNPVFVTLWVAAAMGLALFGFITGLPGFINQTTPPWGAFEIDVTASQWAWEFTYPNGHVADTLHVPVGRPIRLNLGSTDVSHSLAVPALRVNKAAVPGREVQAWFEVTTPGTYALQSNTFSGDGFADMRSELVAHAPVDFGAWMEEVSDIFKGRTLVEVGELLYTRHGCAACHSVDGTKLVGPSFKDLYGYEFDTIEGARVLADDAYIRQSILEPNISVIAGYQPIMASFTGIIDDREIEAITAWFKTLSSKGGAAPDAQEEN